MLTVAVVARSSSDDTLCTSGCADDVMFSRNAANGLRRMGQNKGDVMNIFIHHEKPLATK